MSDQQTCSVLTQKIAMFVAKHLLKVFNKEEITEEVGDTNGIMMFKYTSANTAAPRVLMVPYIQKCTINTSPFTALLYAHYLLSRVWIIHSYIINDEALDIDRLFDQLNANIQAKYGATKDPFHRNQATVAQLSDYEIPGRYESQDVFESPSRLPQADNATQAGNETLRNQGQTGTQVNTPVNTPGGTQVNETIPLLLPGSTIVA